MKRRTIATVWALVLGVTRTADAGVTYLYSPDLAREANPLVSMHGQGWPTLLVVNLLLYAAVMACTLYWWLRPLRYELPGSGGGCWAFASQCYFTCVYPPRTFILRQFFKWPASWKHYIQLIGFVAPPVIAICSLSAILAWCSDHTPALAWYWQLYSLTHAWLPALLALPLYYLFQAIFYRREYRECMNRLASHGGSV